jgi:hypothetical protein
MRDYIGNNLTSIPEVDEKILEALDDKSLYNACRVNNYVFYLCNNSPFLRKRVYHLYQKYYNISFVSKYYNYFLLLNTSNIPYLLLTKSKFSTLVCMYGTIFLSVIVRFVNKF